MTKRALAATAFSAAVAASIGLASPALAIDPGCYAADVVRNATWLAEGPAKQFTLIVGTRNTTDNTNFFTSSADGKVGYNIEKSGAANDDGRLCVAAKYVDVHVNAQPARPSWINLPAGSPNERYLSGQERKNQVRVIFGATAVVRKADGKEYAGPQLVVTKSDKLIDGMVTGAVLTNNSSGNGFALLDMVNLRTNENFDKLAAVQHPMRTASLAGATYALNK